MIRVLIDSSAWIEYLFGTPQGEKVKHIIEDKNSICYTPNIVRTEVISKLIRTGHDTEKAIQTIKQLSIPPIEEPEYFFEAGKKHAELRKSNKNISAADAIIITIAEKNNLKVLTKDSHFKGINTLLI